MSFKVGDKVVFIINSPNKKMTDPKINEIVIIDGFCGCGCGYVMLSGYVIASDGVKQSFSTTQIRKLDYDFVEEVIEMINEDNLVKVNN